MWPEILFFLQSSTNLGTGFQIGQYESGWVCLKQSMASTFWFKWSWGWFCIKCSLPLSNKKQWGILALTPYFKLQQQQQQQHWYRMFPKQHCIVLQKRFMIKNSPQAIQAWDEQLLQLWFKSSQGRALKLFLEKCFYTWSPLFNRFQV